LKKILVTGATGQVGKFLTKKLNQEKKIFTGLDIIEPKILDFDFIKVNLKEKNDFKKYKEKLEDIDILIHLASTVNSGQDLSLNGIDSVNLNIHGTLNLLENLPNLKHISFASSYMVYGKPKANPIYESHVTEPDNIYGASKLITEKILRVFAEKRNQSLTMLRFMGIYGIVAPYVKQAIPSFIEKILNKESPTIFGTGNTKRNHIYIDDAIDAIVVSINKKFGGEFNIGGLEAPSNLEIIKIINNTLESKIKPDFSHSKEKGYSFITDITKAKTKLAFMPNTGITEGIEKTIKKYEMEQNDF